MDDVASPGSGPNGGLVRLRAIMRRLRDPQTGCPWDVEQDFASIAPYTIEEAYEVADAIERGAWDELEGELGDLLLQVVYHAQMAEEAGHFDFDSVAERVAQKMWDRHPHVFGSESNEKTAEQQVADWEAVKARERGPARTLDGVALGLPGLLRAYKLQKRLARVGFDWGATDDVVAKIAEEAAELVEAREAGDVDGLEDEMGDLLFVTANLARHLGVDPEAAIRRTNAKVERRFAAVEDALAARGRTPAQSELTEMDALWNEVRVRDRRAPKNS